MAKPIPELPSIRLTDIDALTLLDWNHFDSIYPCWRLYWNQDPGAWIEFCGAHQLGPDRLVLVPPFARVDLRNEAPIRHLYLCFEAAPPYTYARRRIYTVPIEQPTATSAANLYEDISSTNRISSAGLACLQLISSALQAVPPEDWLDVPVDARIQRILLEIEHALGENLSNETFAGDLGLTPNSFARLFRKEVGISPHRYILQRRLVRASHLLMQGQPIEQVAERTGFCDRYYFTRMFIQTFGVSPGRYRQRGTTVTLSSLKTP